MQATINGIEFGYDVLGESGMPMVLIHGFGLNRKIWMPVVSAYLRNQMVILPDVRGHGESEALKGPYPMDLLAEDTVNLLAFLGIEKAVVCGHSMGGYITLAFAKAYPQRLAGMGLITTRAEADTEEGRAGRYKLIEAVYKRGSLPLAESLAPRLTKDKTLALEMRALLAETSPAGIIGALEGMAERPDCTNFLRKIAQPALVVAGGEDQIIDMENAKLMAEALPDGDFLPIPQAGHLPMLETPAELGKGLLRLVRRVETLQE